MEQHFEIIWECDLAVSVIGKNADEKLYTAFLQYHEEKDNYYIQALDFAEWCFNRGYRVHLYTVLKSPIEKLSLRFMTWLGKIIGEISDGIIIRRPKTKPQYIMDVLDKEAMLWKA
jgi:hypothetical protein